MKTLQLNKFLLEKLSLLLLISLMIQLVFTVSLSSQYEIKSRHLRNSNNKEVKEEEPNVGEGQKANRLTLSPEMIYFLMKRFANNPKLQEYLKVLKKKKYDETYAEEEPFYDYNYQGKFRF